MNLIFLINKRYIFILSVIMIFLLILIYQLTTIENITNNKVIISNIDVSQPKFVINNNRQKIYITAKEANFINKNEVSLNKNVRFKSSDFSIETEKVIFNREKQTARSKDKSYFKTKNAIINSYGFDIYEKGNKIIFYGKTFIKLK